MNSYWVSCRDFTVRVDVDDAGVIRQAAPIVRKFIGQPLSNLLTWKRNTEWVRLPHKES